MIERTLKLVGQGISVSQVAQIFEREADAEKPTTGPSNNVERNFRVIMLGADLPLADLPAAVKRSNSRAIVVAANFSVPAFVLRKELRVLTEVVEVPVFVGGHQAFRYKQELGKAGAIFLGDQIAQGLALIEAKLSFQTEGSYKRESSNTPFLLALRWQIPSLASAAVLCANGAGVRPRIFLSQTATLTALLRLRNCSQAMTYDFVNSSPSNVQFS
jgi:hypothetical protein